MNSGCERPQVVVLGWERVTKGFDARKQCDRRRYEYLLPASALRPDPSQNHRASACAPAQRDTTGADATAAAANGGSCSGGAAAEPPSATVNSGVETARAAAAPAAEGAAGASDAHASVNGGLVAAGAATEPAAERAMGAPNIPAAVNGGLAPVEIAAPAAQGAGTASEAPAPDNGSSAPAQTDLAPAADGAGAASEAPAAKTGSLVPAEAAKAPAQGDAVREVGEVGSGLGSELGLGQDAEMKPLDEGERACVDAVLAQYEGTHSFHSFTVRTFAGDPAAKRYILSFRVGGTLELQARRRVLAMHECSI